MTAKEFLNKYDNHNYAFTADELRDLYWWDIEEDDDIIIEDVEHINGEKRRWSRMESEIRCINNRYFCFSGDIGLTECQDDEFYTQPYEVYPKEELIKVIKWVEV